MKNPLVSIVIPAYNMEAYAGEAVRSALGQSYAPIEVIVVNDGSTDGTEGALAPFRKDKRFVYVFQKNKGLAGARNAGIKISNGKYVALLDADDIFLPQKIGEQVGFLESHADFGVCYCDLLHLTDGEPRKFYHHRYDHPSGDIFKPLLWRQFINPLAIVARRELFEKYGYFDENLRRSEDWDLWLRWAHAGVKFHYLDKILAHYRVRAVGNLSAIGSEPMMKEKNLELFTRFGKTLTAREWEQYEFSKVLDLLRKKLVLAYLMVGDKQGALAHAKDISGNWRLLIRLIPGRIFKSLFGFARSVKHRLLLKKL